ncbi:endonuclease/exonuclease/phosphatase family protein [Actinoplanes derwentensis]|uniref:Metal-dependent hydrolase, endonuclease/exonuclease/phosphatase family n=1 Tax=Actinoplanes derwentensis TaxID=113562 RepID=A0A1H2CVM4_9ACTN|nr:endonuclease/exonuclease/phosphatase family protein [Actinoplanes derwentensis]GID82061.1 hypothetical protein Ade03nite_09850 [Actinoplanes derwentensis]SDT74511.1 Metal-dependent hydrolase, endonuclease/exonuclease/phosphatase family [Actinoplanes derwentensis]
MTTLLTINTLDLYGSDAQADQDRYGAVEDLIRSYDADVIAVQEVIADGASVVEKRVGAEAGLRRLAAAVGRDCEVDGRAAVAAGGIIHHPGLLWRAGIEPVPGSLHTLQRDGAGMWHGAVSVILDLGGLRVRVGSCQLSPFSPTWRRRDAEQLLRLFNSDAVPGLLGGDFNVIGGDCVYDPDPYENMPWHPDHAYQLTDHGAPDRSAAHLLEANHLGRMRDCARLTGTWWAATTGHHPADQHPPRRLDRWYATWDFPADAIAGLAVADVEQVGTTTDHLPVLLHLDLDALSR